MYESRTVLSYFCIEVTKLSSLVLPSLEVEHVKLTRRCYLHNLLTHHHCLQHSVLEHAEEQVLVLVLVGRHAQRYSEVNRPILIHKLQLTLCVCVKSVTLQVLFQEHIAQLFEDCFSCFLDCSSVSLLLCIDQICIPKLLLQLLHLQTHHGFEAVVVSIQQLLTSDGLLQSCYTSIQSVVLVSLHQVDGVLTELSAQTHKVILLVVDGLWLTQVLTSLLCDSRTLKQVLLSGWVNLEDVLLHTLLG